MVFTKRSAYGLQLGLCAGIFTLFTPPTLRTAMNAFENSGSPCNFQGERESRDRLRSAIRDSLAIDDVPYPLPSCRPSSRLPRNAPDLAGRAQPVRICSEAGRKYLQGHASERWRRRELVCRARDG